jgi:hypothetical protein
MVAAASEPAPGRGSVTGSGIQNVYLGEVIKELSDADPRNIQQVSAAQLALSTSYYKNVLQQAQRSFIAAIASATMGLLFFIAAVSILLARNDVRAGTVSVISGGIVEVIAGLNFWLYGRTAFQLNSFHIRLEQTQKYLMANSIATKLGTEKREIALSDLIRVMTSQPIFDQATPREKGAQTS